MIQIKPIRLCLPSKEGVSLLVRILAFETTSITAQLYWEVQDIDTTVLANGNIQLTEDEFTNWGDSNDYIENIALKHLNLDRL